MRRWLCLITVLISTHVALCQTDKQSPPNSTKRTPSPDVVRKDRAFDPFVPRHAAEKLFAIENFQTKSLELSRLASLIWKYDEDYARALFEKALAVSHPQNNSSDGRLKFVYRSVIGAIATKDPLWAKRLIDGQTFTAEKDRNSANMSTALALIDYSPGQAVEFAQRALNDQLHPLFIHFLLALRKTDQPRADQVFLDVLRFLGQQPAPNIQDLHSIGVYLFTAPEVLSPDHYVVTVVDRIIVPNITVQRPNMSPELVRAYLSTSSSLLLRAATDPEQKQRTFTLGRLLLPKARLETPDLVPQIEAAMAAVSSGVPPTLTNEAAFKYIDMKPPTPEESLANAERKTDDLEREMAFLDIALSAWWKSDFKTVRKAASMIQNIEASQALNQLLDFGEAALLLKSDAANVAAAERVAYKLTPGLERALLLLAIAQTRVKSGNIARAEEAIDASLKAAAAVDDVRRPRLSLTAAGLLAQLRSLRTPTVTASTIKDFNSIDSGKYPNVNWSRDVQVGALTSSFPLEISGLDLTMEPALRAIFLSDLDIGFARAQEIKNEGLRARAMVEFVAAYIEKMEKNSQSKRPAAKP